MKAPGVPTWVTAFVSLVGLYCTLIGIIGLIDPTTVPEFVSGADNLGTAWAGRMSGTGVAMIAAVALRSAAGYVIALAASVFREIGDAIVSASGTSDGLPVIVVLIVLGIDLAAFAICLRAVVRPAMDH